MHMASRKLPSLARTKLALSTSSATLSHTHWELPRHTAVVAEYSSSGIEDPRGRHT